MIWVLLLVGLGVFIGGLVIANKSYNYETYGEVIAGIGLAIAILTVAAAIILIVCCADTAKIDEKIELYETENAKIEQQMAEMVRGYQDYEQKIFGEVTEENVMSYITLYPELKSDALVEKQMTIYYSNYEKITKLKEEQLLTPIYRWWVYFGG